MITTQDDDVTFTARGDAVEARLTRILDNTPLEVWSALTQPDRLVEWLAPGAIELREGGAARLDFADSGIVIDSQVTVIEPPRLLEYSWSGPGEPPRPLRWEVEPTADGVRLNLTLLTPAGEDAGRACAGFAAHLDMLAAALAGVPIKFPFERFKAARDAFRAQLAPLAQPSSPAA